MKKVLAITALAALLATPAAAWTVDEMNDTINSANFIVGGGCSGTLISKKYRLILTNHHCIGAGVKQRSKQVVSDDGEILTKKVEELVDMDVSQRVYKKHRLVGEATHKAEIVARWKESDLALLQVRGDLMNPIAARVFSGDEVKRGETIYTVGNPLGLDATVNKGVVSSVTRMFRVGWAEAEVPFLQIDAGISGGNSGGALFNDDGKLIGVPAAGVPNNGHLGLAIPFFRVQEFLTDNCFGEVWDEKASDRATCLSGDGVEDE